MIRALRIFALALCSVVLVHQALARTEDTAASPSDSRSFELGVQYENGEGIGQDYSRALQLYCDAANHGDARAFFSLGWMYANGRGIPRDEAVAVGWWQKAAAGGVAQAANLLRMLSNTVPSARLGCEPPPPPPTAWQSHPSPKLVGLVQRVAASIGLDARLVLAVIAAESAFDARAVSPRNAMGLMQLTPETAARYGVRDPFDSEQNIRGGTTYLRWLLRRFAGNLTLALAAYNAGEGTVDYYRGVPPFAETIGYIARIKRLYTVADASP